MASKYQLNYGRLSDCLASNSEAIKAFETFFPPVHILKRIARAKKGTNLGLSTNCFVKFPNDGENAKLKIQGLYCWILTISDQQAHCDLEGW